DNRSFRADDERTIAPNQSNVEEGETPTTPKWKRRTMYVPLASDKKLYRQPDPTSIRGTPNFL
ncbi:MAG: hypothetical protein WA869_35705, partial [Alloacidobacterium sp.]